MEGDTSSNKKENKNSKESQDRPADILAIKMFRELKKNYSIIAKGRVISWKLWLVVGIMVGATAGVVYVANRSGEFEAGKAQSLVEVSSTIHDDFGQEIAKVGTTNLNHQWKTISLERPFLNPVVIAKPISMNGSNPAHVRVRFSEEIELDENISANSFQMRIEEWNYQDGTHTNEQVSYIVMESGVHTIDNKKIEAGYTRAGHVFSTANFSGNFATSPVLLTQSQTIEELDPIVTRNQDITATGFRVKVQEDEASVSVNGGNHEKEIIGYIAAEGGIYKDDSVVKFEFGRIASVKNRWLRSFVYPVNKGIFLADMQTTNDEETASIRYRNLTSNSVEIKVQEEKSKDREMTHKAEDVGYFLAEGAIGTLMVEVAGSTPSSHYVAVGDEGVSGVAFAKFKFTASNNEDIELGGLRITLAQGNNSGIYNNDIPNFVALHLYKDDVKIGSTVYPSGSNDVSAVNLEFYFDTNIDEIIIPEGGSVVLTLKADMNGTLNGAKSMTTPNFYIADVEGLTNFTASDIFARGLASGSLVIVSAGSPDPSELAGTEPVNVNAMRIVGSKPIFELCTPANCSKASPSGVLVPGTTEVIRFRIWAEQGDVVFDGLNHNIMFTIVQNGGATTGRAAALYELGKGVPLDTVSEIDLTTAGTIDFYSVSTTIARDTYKEYHVIVDLSDYITAGDAFRLSIEEFADDLSWSDGVTTDIAIDSITDGLPVIGGALVK